MTTPELKFGTSGRRGLLIHLSQLEIYINALAELRYLQSLPREEGGIGKGEEFYFAFDLRPSSAQFVADANGRGEICQAIVRAVEDAGMRPVNLGAIPTPALTYYALRNNKGSIMVTGSHIPFDRNGYKLNTSQGELLKTHEELINRAVAEERSRPHPGFTPDGMLEGGHRDLPPVDPDGARAYRDRYVDFFGSGALAGKRFLFYQHSAVGRDLVPEILRALGAEIVTAGRSETFVPIDTENIDDDQLNTIQALSDGSCDAVISTDGDSDRPLLLGVQPDGKLRFFGGDLVGMIVAEYLGADALVVPISCNDAIDRGNLKHYLRPKTKIGSPFVIAGMEEAVRSGARIVCGWEANGGFLLGSDVVRGDKKLHKLATRDALLPLICALCASKNADLSLPELFETLPKRYSRAALLRNFSRPTSLKIIEIKDFAPFFPFSDIQSVDYTDGARITFKNNEVAHIRPSGNADELRIYAVADTQQRADEITRMGVAEPDGILRCMARFVDIGM